jgi:hypothetical protein
MNTGFLKYFHVSMYTSILACVHIDVSAFCINLYIPVRSQVRGRAKFVDTVAVRIRKLLYLLHLYIFIGCNFRNIYNYNRFFEIG